MATPPQDQKTSTAPFAKGSIIWQKKAGLPVWVWALLLLAALVLFSSIRRNRTPAAADYPASADNGLPPGSFIRPVFIVPQAPVSPVTVVNGGTGGGGTVPPPNRPPIIPETPPETPPGAGSTPPITTPPPVSPTPPGIMVDVVRFQGNPPPWNSTIWGIWNRYRTTPTWEAMWNHPMNNDLRARRGIPEHIQPGDRVFVPGAS